MQKIEFSANVAGIRTTMGGGFRVSLDIPEMQVTEAAKMLAFYLKNVKATIELREE